MSKNKNKNQGEQAVYSWDGPEYIRYQKGKIWYLSAFAVAVLFFTWALFEHSWPLIVSTLCMVVAYYFYDQKLPQEVKISLSRFGISVGDKLTPFSELKSFYIDYNPPLRAVHFQHRSHFKSDFGVIFPAELSVEDLRYFLLTQLPEQKPEDRSLLEMILKAFRF